MANVDKASGTDLEQRINTVFINTNLHTHLASIVYDVDTVFDLKKRLLLEHPLCFPDVGDIKISALMVKRRGHLYHLSDSMFVKKAFDGLSKSWFLFVEATRVEGQSKNLQLQQIDSNKHIECQTSGVEPSSKRLSDIEKSGHSLEKDQHVKSKPLACLSGVDKLQPNDFEMETERDGTNTKVVPFPDAYSRPIENASVDNQKVSAATDHHSLSPKPLEKLKDHARNLERLNSSSIRHEAKDVHDNSTPEGAMKTEVTEKRKRKPKRKTRSSDNHKAGKISRPSHPSVLASAVNTYDKVSSNPDKASAIILSSGNIEFETPKNAAPDEIEPLGTGREIANTQDRSSEAVADVTQNEDGADVQQNAKSAEEISTSQSPAKKKRKTEKKHGKEDAMAGSIESMLNANKAISMPEAFSPQSSSVHREKVLNLDLNKLPSDHLQASGGLTTMSTVDNKKKRKKPSKDINHSAAATTSSRDPVGGTGKPGVLLEGEPDAAVTTGNVYHPGVVSESFASLPRRTLDDSLTIAIAKESERGEKNVDDVGSGNAILNAADNLQTTDLASKGKKEANVDKVAALEKEGELPIKDDAEAMANRDDGTINTGEAKPVKSSKGKNKSKKAKNPDQGPLVTSSAQHVEGRGTGTSSAGPFNPVDGEKPIERGVENVDDVGIGKAVLNAADNLQTTDLASKGRKEANVDIVAGLENEGEFPMKDEAEAMSNRDDWTINTDEAKPAKSSKGKKKSKKAKNCNQGNLVTICAQHVEGSGTSISSAETFKPVDGEKPIEGGVENVDDVGIGKAILTAADNLRTTDLASKVRKEANVGEVSSLGKEGEFPMKDDGEATANRDDGRISTDGAKSAKSSKGKKKSKNAKNAKNPDQGTLVTFSVQHIEGPGTGISSAEPIKPADGKEPDSVIRSVLDSLQQNKEQENLEKTEKKSRKKTGKRLTLNVVAAQGLLVEENIAAHNASIVSSDIAKETDDSSKPSKNAKQSAEVADSSQDTMLHKLNGYSEVKPSDQIQPSHEKEKVDVGDSVVSRQTENDAVENVQTHDQGAIGTRVDKGEAKSKKKEKVPDLHPGGSVTGLQSSKKPIEKEGSSEKAQPAGLSTSQQPSKVQNDSLDGSSLSNKDLRGSSAIGAEGDASEKCDKNLKAANLGTLNDSAACFFSKKTKEPHMASNSSIGSFRESSEANVADCNSSNVDEFHASVKGASKNKGGVKSPGLHGIMNDRKDHERKLLLVSGSILENDKNQSSGDYEPDASSSSTKRPSDASSDDSDEDSDKDLMFYMVKRRVEET